MANVVPCRIPDVRLNERGEERRVGVEIELSGLGYDELVHHVARLLEGEAQLASRYVTRVDTGLGTFTVELDSDPIKDLALDDERLPRALRELSTQAMDVIDAAAERIVPLEIVTPPIPLSQLQTVEELVAQLRDLGALGSRKRCISRSDSSSTRSCRPWIRTRWCATFRRSPVSTNGSNPAISSTSAASSPPTSSLGTTATSSGSWPTIMRRTRRA